MRSRSFLKQQRRTWVISTLPPSLSKDDHEVTQPLNGSAQAKTIWSHSTLPPSCFEQRRSWGHETSQRLSTSKERSWVIPHRRHLIWVKTIMGHATSQWFYYFTDDLDLFHEATILFLSHMSRTPLNVHKNRDVLESLLTAFILLKYIYNLRNIAAEKFWNSQNPWSTVPSGIGNSILSALQTALLQVIF